MAARLCTGKLAFAAIAILSLIAGCAPRFPANTPPQIHHTPGAYIVVLDGYVDAGDFRLSYPSNWRLIQQSTAQEDALQLVLVAPDGGRVTLQQVERAEGSAGRVIGLATGKYVHASVEPAIEPDPGFNGQVEQILESVRA